MVKVIPNTYKKFSFIFVSCQTWWELSQYLPNWTVLRQQQLEVGEGTSSEIQNWFKYYLSHSTPNSCYSSKKIV